MLHEHRISMNVRASMFVHPWQIMTNISSTPSILRGSKLLQFARTVIQTSPRCHLLNSGSKEGIWEQQLPRRTFVIVEHPPEWTHDETNHGRSPMHRASQNDASRRVGHTSLCAFVHLQKKAKCRKSARKTLMLRKIEYTRLSCSKVLREKTNETRLYPTPFRSYFMLE